MSCEVCMKISWHRGARGPAGWAPREEVRQHLAGAEGHVADVLHDRVRLAAGLCHRSAASAAGIDSFADHTMYIKPSFGAVFWNSVDTVVSTTMLTFRETILKTFETFVYIIVTISSQMFLVM